MSDKIHRDVTNAIIAAIEAGADDWQMPWHGGDRDLILPANIDTGKNYQGINIVLLWTIARSQGFETNVWGTRRQWEKRGYQVRKEERSSPVVYYGPITIKPDDDSDDQAEPIIRTASRLFKVFNADQVDGYEVDPPDPFPRITVAECFVKNTGAVVIHRGTRAFFRPLDDRIFMPKPGHFFDTKNSTAVEGYYATLLHELVHWTGTPDRCKRKLTGRFGEHDYAFEELVAELGAAFLCAELRISLELRPDHAQYINNWLQVLKNHNKAIFTAASQASKAIKFLKEFQVSEQNTNN